MELSYELEPEVRVEGFLRRQSVLRTLHQSYRSSARQDQPGFQNNYLMLLLWQDLDHNPSA